MTAAIARHESFVELPSRRLRQESERFLAPALLAAASLVAALMIAYGAIPTSSIRVVNIPVPEGRVDLLRDWLLPASDAAQQPNVVTFPERPADVRPVEHVDPEAVTVPSLIVDNRDGISRTDHSIDGAGATGPASGEGRGSVQPLEEPQPGDVFLGDELPSVVSRVTPEYPPFARDAGVEGTVLVWALVGVSGRVEDAQVQRSIPMLDSAALEAVRKWRFTPALANLHPVRVWVAVPVRFRLHD